MPAMEGQNDSGITNFDMDDAILADLLAELEISQDAQALFQPSRCLVKELSLPRTSPIRGVRCDCRLTGI
jgi:hypothetical protein